jgi:hypothetical protein
MHVNDAWAPHGVPLLDAQCRIVVREVMRHELTRERAGRRARGGIFDDPQRRIEEPGVSDRVGAEGVQREEIAAFALDHAQDRRKTRKVGTRVVHRRAIAERHCSKTIDVDDSVGKRLWRLLR